jgi:hypothetical protein
MNASQRGNMHKRLQIGFVGQFSLRRLGLATVFLGVFVGLNSRPVGPVWLGGWHVPSYYWGWPLPLAKEPAFSKPEGLSLAENEKWYARDWELKQSSYHYQLPWTHLTYRLLSLPFHQPSFTASRVVIDVLCAVIPLTLVLFLRIHVSPQRPAPCGGCSGPPVVGHHRPAPSSDPK